jgi:copper(I)-binding protein
MTRNLRLTAIFARLVLTFVALLLVACGKPAGPLIVIDDARILAPLPGTNAGVAYMRIVNNSDAPVTIGQARSPQFERVELHETTIVDGVSRMRALDSVEVPAGGSVVFEAGGRHLMLIGMVPEAGAGSPVTIEIAYSGGLLVVSATMQDRLQSD